VQPEQTFIFISDKQTFLLGKTKAVVPFAHALMNWFKLEMNTLWPWHAFFPRTNISVSIGPQKKRKLLSKNAITSRATNS
jgi:hypothetical protein